MMDSEKAEEPKLSRSERIDRVRGRAWALQIHYRWESGGSETSLRDALVETTQTRRIAPRRLPYIRGLMTVFDEHMSELDGAIRRAPRQLELGKTLIDGSRCLENRSGGTPVR